MSVEQVKSFLQKAGFSDRYLEFAVSSATVELAAAAIGCEPERIIKTLAFKTKQGPVLVCACGGARVDNQKFKTAFGEKASFLKGEEVALLTGHPIGGVCPFALPANARVYLDESIRPYAPAYPAAGAPNNAVRLTPDELQQLTGAQWVDVCKAPQTAQ